jgi:hypothetical protein
MIAFWGLLRAFTIAYNMNRACFYSRKWWPYLGDIKINGIDDYFGWTKKIDGLYLQLAR